MKSVPEFVHLQTGTGKTPRIGIHMTFDRISDRVKRNVRAVLDRLALEILMLVEKSPSSERTGAWRGPLRHGVLQRAQRVVSNRLVRSSRS